MSPGPSMSCKGSLGIHGVQWPEYGDGARASLEYGKKKKSKKKMLNSFNLGTGLYGLRWRPATRVRLEPQGEKEALTPGTKVEGMPKTFKGWHSD